MIPASTRYQQVLERIRGAELRHGSTPGSVDLLAVSKTKPAAAILELAQQGQRAFGENYVQEALPKITQLASHGLEWHFIGPLQANKTRAVAEHFAWCHSLDRERIALRLNAQRPEPAPPLNVLIEVNADAELSKSGVAPADVPALAAIVTQLPRLRLRGLMALPAPVADVEAQRQVFRRVRSLFETLNAAGLDLDTLSIGTSADFEAAIAEGATMVRIGTALFGPRELTPSLSLSSLPLTGGGLR
jgi:hypothetical protein